MTSANVGSFDMEVDPESVGLDAAALERLSPLFERWVTSEQMPNATALVARHGKIAWWKGCGEQNPGVPLNRETIFRIYSMTKPITSVAIMMLVERGQLQLYQPVWHLLGKNWKAKNMQVYVSGSADDMKLEPCKTDITILQLLTHTSGISYGFGGTEGFNPVAKLHQEAMSHCPIGFDSVETVSAHVTARGILGSRRSLTEAADIIAKLPLVCQPGTHFHYGWNVGILGRIVEVVSGMSLGDFFHSHIFVPLQMQDTSFVLPIEKKARLANCWYRAGYTSDKQIDITDYERQGGDYIIGRSKLEDGGGGLLSTMGDFFRFCQCILDGGVSRQGARILSTKTVEFMFKNHLPGGKDTKSIIAFPGYNEQDRPGIGFGLGFACVQDVTAGMVNTSLGEVGWGGLASTVFYIDPVEDLVVIFMTQCIGINRVRFPIGDVLRNVVSGALVRRPTIIAKL